MTDLLCNGISHHGFNHGTSLKPGDQCPLCGMTLFLYDIINQPPHYKSASGLECIDVIEAFGLGFHLGNTIKYILRAGKKGDRKEDLMKAKWYLEREIEKS